MDYLKAIILFFVFVPVSQSAINPFRTSDITIRAQGVTTKPSIFDQLLAKPAKPTNTAGATLEGNYGLKVGKSDFEVMLEKDYKAADIASAAAGAIFTKTVPGLIAGLALPYVIDAVTGQIDKVVQPDPTEPLTSQLTAPDSVFTRVGVTGVLTTSPCLVQPFDSISDALTASLCQYNKSFTSKYSLAQSRTIFFQNGYWRVTSSLLNSNGTSSGGSLSVYVSNDCSALGGGYAINPSTAMCLRTGICTSPSVYDTTLGMCIGSAINEPANRATLEQDIYDTFHNVPSAAPLALDELMIKNNVPVTSNEPTTLGDNLPANSTALGSSTTETMNGFDPATAHPTTTTTTTTTNHGVEKTGPSEVTVTNVTNTTVNVTDNVTNITTTTTNGKTEDPVNEQEQPQQTDCEKNPQSVGCTDLGTAPDAEAIPVTQQSIALNPTSLGAGTCPPPQTIDLTLTGDITMSYQPYCDFAQSVKPLIVAFAWLSAGFIVVRSARES